MAKEQVPAGKPATLVCGFDFSPQSTLALDRAIALAAGDGSALVHVVTVRAGSWPTAGGAAVPCADPIPQGVVGAVEAALVRHGRPGVRVFIHQRFGDPADEILALATEVEAAVIVLGTHGREGLERLLVGSVAEKVVRQARCTVVVARPMSYAAAAAAPDAPDAPCPACVARRGETHGAEWSCEAHRHRWTAPHRYAYTDAGINRLRPDEWALW